MDGRARRPAAAMWLWQVAAGLSAFHLGLVGWLATVALAPSLAGWTPYVITSGSMAPRIPLGAVVVAASPPEGRLDPGTVVVFSDRSGRTVTHRVVEVDAAGHYRTKGDANPVADTTTVSPADVRGVGRILVPFVGLPLVWALHGRWPATLAAVAITMLAAWTVRAVQRRAGAGEDPAAKRPADRDRRLPGPRRRRVAAGLTACTAIAALSTSIAYTGATFVASAGQPGNRWSAAAQFSGFDAAATTASDLPAGAASASQTFRFAPVGALPAGAKVTIELTAAHRGPVDYRSAVQPTASAGGAVLETAGGNSPQRTARIVFTVPAGGLAHGSVVTVTIPSGIRTTGAATGLPAVFTRGDSGATHTASFAVR